MLHLIVVHNSLGEKYWEFYGMLTIIFDMLWQSLVNFEWVYFELWNFKWIILFGIMLCFDYILLKGRNGTSLKYNIMMICDLWIYESMSMRKEVHVLPRAVTFVLELWPKKRVSLCLSCWVVGLPIGSSVCVWSCVGQLVGTLSGFCPVRQHVFAASQFVEDFCVL